MVECMAAITILVIATGAILTSLLSVTSLAQTSKETRLAVDAARNTIEAIKGEDFRDVYAMFNANPDDDPDGAATAPGNVFVVVGLNVREDDADGFVGEIILPGDGKVLREDLVDDVLGTPRDLNGDATLDAADHAGDYTILPVRVRIEWTGKTGERSLEIVTVLTWV